MTTISIGIELSSFFKFSVIISFLKSKPLSVTLCYRLNWLHFLLSLTTYCMSNVLVVTLKLHLENFKELPSNMIYCIKTSNIMIWTTQL